MFDLARANLALRSPTWNIEETTNGFLGFGKTPSVLSYVDPFAAEQILNKSFMRAAWDILSDDPVFRRPIVFFVPKRGELRAVSMIGKQNAGIRRYDRELERAKAAWSSADIDAVCPAELENPNTAGFAFVVGDRFDGKAERYCPLIENVRPLVVQEKTLQYATNGSTAPKQKLTDDLWLCLGVRDDDGDIMLLTTAQLQELELPFEASLEKMIAQIPALPLVGLGELSTGEPVVGFRGNGALDQLARADSMMRLHERLGNPCMMHVYRPEFVSATVADVAWKRETILEMVALFNKPRGSVPMNAPEYTFYSVMGGRVRWKLAVPSGRG